MVGITRSKVIFFLTACGFRFFNFFWLCVSCLLAFLLLLVSAGFCLLLFFRVFVDSVLCLFIAVCCFVLLFAFVCYVFVVVVA